MKALICSVCVLLLITVFIIFSAFYISSLCSSLSDMILSLPASIGDYASFNEIYTSIHSKWNSRKSYIRSTVGHSDTEEIDGALEEISVRFSSGDVSGYLSARRRLISLLEELRQAETFSWYSLG